GHQAGPCSQRGGRLAARIRSIGHPGVPAQAGRLSQGGGNMRRYGKIGSKTSKHQALRHGDEAQEMSAAPMLRQRTLKTAIKTTGVGLHTGARVDLVLRPAAPDTGVVFHRVDLPQEVTIPAQAINVGDTRLSSSLEKDGARISTVEHLM